ncbi:MAG: hypothetical protein M1840_005740 [Geoglossum simile]|nr:MAG: hypothetical protein M1840_005740 [Geoglossum simile]
MRDLLRCPFPSCNGEETYTKKQNMFRHYQTHIECFETCAFCDRTFNYLRKLVKHLEDCKIKKTQDRQEGSIVQVSIEADRTADESKDEK